MDKNPHGFLLVISGPSGAGKGTIISGLLDRFNEMSLVTSWTTREPRYDEKNGVQYVFVTKEQFQEKVQAKGFLEWAMVYDNYYGTPIEDVNALVNKGKIAVLEIDVQGARSVRSNPMVDEVSIFIAPPDKGTLANRLRKRSTEDEKSLEIRLMEASKEVQEAKYFDYIIVNNLIEMAIKDAEAAIKGEFHRSRWAYNRLMRGYAQ
jgi:guanylate kinase